jgi:citrate lyase beta subunit
MLPRSSCFGDRFCLTLLTNDPRRAAAADRAGADRIGIDRENLGKAERQAGQDSRISAHDWPDLRAIAPMVQRADLFVRTNPLHSETASEVETALQLGARVLMLPGVRTPEDVATFTALVRGRAIVSILIELAPAVVRIRDILEMRGIDEVMIGLNDLHLQMGVANHFEVMASPLLDMLAAETRRRGLPLAIGGVGRAGDDGLPIPADLVYAQYPRLGATGAWIARSFDRDSGAVPNYDAELALLRDRLTKWAESSAEELEGARADLASRAARWVRPRFGESES